MLIKTLCALACGLLATHALGQTTWKVATGYKADNFIMRNIADFGKEVETATQGALRFEYHYGASLLKLPEILPGVREGKVQMGDVLMAGIGKDFPLATADSIPFIARSYADAQRMWATQKPTLEKEFEAKGLKLLFVTPWPPQALYSRTEVRAVEDFKDMRMRTYSPSTVKIAQSLGAQPVDVANPDLQAALAAGKVDSLITSPATGVESKIYEALPHYYGINAWIPKNVTFISLSAFQAQPPAVQKAVLQAAQAAQERGWKQSELVAQQSLDTLKAKGMRVLTIPVAVARRFDRVGEAFTSEWLKSAGHSASATMIPYFIEKK